jgi:hypothetical protein
MVDIILSVSGKVFPVISGQAFDGMTTRGMRSTAERQNPQGIGPEDD